MVEVEVGDDDGIKLTEIDVPPQLRQRSGAEIEDDVRLAARYEVATAALARIWPSGRAAERDESHLVLLPQSRMHCRSHTH
jgi:hypothetical protein